MKQNTYHHNFAAQICYQIVQTYTGNDETLVSLHGSKEITFPKVFESQKAPQQMIEKVLKWPVSNDWTFSIKRRFRYSPSLDSALDDGQIISSDHNSNPTFEMLNPGRENSHRYLNN